MNTDLKYPYFLTAEYQEYFIGAKVNDDDDVYNFMKNAYEVFNTEIFESVRFEGFPMCLFRS